MLPRRPPWPPVRAGSAVVNATQSDPHFKKTVTLAHAGRRLELAVAQDLFSSHEVDVGTRLLLRTLAGPGPGPARRRLALDLGCGYGPIGLGLRAAGAVDVVHLVDRDALAVDYSRENAARNRLDGVEAYGSLGYADVRAAGFDLIAANIPAKAGAPVIERLLLDAGDLLAPGGLVAVVVVAPLADFVAAVLERPGIEVELRRATASYTVFHYRFADPGRAGGPGRVSRPGRAGGTGQPEGTGRASGAGGVSGPAPGETDGLAVYERQRVTLARGGVRLRLRTVWGLPEFDSLGFATELAADALGRLGGRPPGAALVLNPGQGQLPALLWAALAPRAIRLVDRDLLALRVSQANLVANGCPPERVASHHRAGPGPADLSDADLVVAVLRPKEPPAAAVATVRTVVAGLPRGGRVVLGASSTMVTRCLAALAEAGLEVDTVDRRRRRGFSAVVLRVA
jgi:16S rRNA (guanine1207-N2)-methyltransferase